MCADNIADFVAGKAPWSRAVATVGMLAAIALFAVAQLASAWDTAFVIGDVRPWEFSVYFAGGVITPLLVIAPKLCIGDQSKGCILFELASPATTGGTARMYRTALTSSQVTVKGVMDRVTSSRAMM